MPFFRCLFVGKICKAGYVMDNRLSRLGCLIFEQILADGKVQGLRL